MKLQERQPIREQRLKARDALVATSAELSLNEQIGLSPKLEKRLRSRLEVEAKEYTVCRSQVETAIHLITLFPAEADTFIQQAPVDELIPVVDAMIQNTSHIGVSAEVKSDLYLLSFLAPQLIPTLSDREGTGLLAGVRSRGDNGLRLMWGAQAMRLFPHQAKTIREKTEGVIDDMLNASQVPSGSLLFAIKHALEIDPTLHSKLHTYALSHAEALKSFLNTIKVTDQVISSTMGWPLTTEKVSGMFATYKLLLADEITVSPTGILLAVEKPQLRGGNPLPDRSLAV